MDLVNVFGDRCQTIARELNLTAEENFEEALKEAEIKDKERLEAIRENRVSDLGPLHGIPVSIKDFIMVKGLMFTIGCVHLTHKKCEEDAVVTSLIKESGAIILVKGNVPHSGGMGYYTSNPVFG